MSTPTDVPPGWPGDDPTVPEDLARLGARPRTVRGRHRRPPPRPHTDTGPVGTVTDADVVDLDGDLDTGLAEQPVRDPGRDADPTPAGRRGARPTRPTTGSPASSPPGGHWS